MAEQRINVRHQIGLVITVDEYLKQVLVECLQSTLDDGFTFGCQAKTLTERIIRSAHFKPLCVQGQIHLAFNGRRACAHQTSNFSLINCSVLSNRGQQHKLRQGDIGVRPKHLVESLIERIGEYVQLIEIRLAKKER